MWERCWTYSEILKICVFNEKKRGKSENRCEIKGKNTKTLKKVFENSVDAAEKWSAFAFSAEIREFQNCGSKSGKLVTYSEVPRCQKL